MNSPVALGSNQWFWPQNLWIGKPESPLVHCFKNSYKYTFFHFFYWGFLWDTGPSQGSMGEGRGAGGQFYFLFLITTFTCSQTFRCFFTTLHVRPILLILIMLFIIKNIHILQSEEVINAIIEYMFCPPLEKRSIHSYLSLLHVKYGSILSI